MALLGKADHSTQCIPRQFDQVAMLAFLVDLIDQPAREVVPIDASEALLIPTENGLEVAGLFGVANHLPELLPLERLGTADGVVFVPTDDATAFALGELQNFSPLLFRAVFLLVGAHADVVDGRRQFAIGFHSWSFRMFGPRAHVLTRVAIGFVLGNVGQQTKRRPRWAPLATTWQMSRHLALRANSPRSILLNRASLPFWLICLSMAA